MGNAQHTLGISKIALRGKRGNYSLVHDGVVIHKGSNKERLRGVQYFLEANPQYLAAPLLAAALEAFLDAGKIAGVFGPYLETGKIPAEQYREGRAALAKAEGRKEGE